jgi:pimeloyl-ACP methyl ester carboxylesterase
MRFASVLCSALLSATPLFAQATDIGAPPGQLVDIGGRKLHLHCTGSSSPNVILEAGASAFAIDWSLVQPEIARANRVCSYDRAGSGWSDPPKGVNTPAGFVADLHAALQAAGVKPPYVMVGASMGGIYVRLYSITYAGEVAAMVLVDPSSEERLFTVFQGKPVTIASLTADQVRSTVKPGAATVPRRSPQTGAPFDQLPRELYDLRVELETRLIASIPESVPHDIVAASAEGERAALARLHEASAMQDHPLGDRPLVVLTRGMDSSQGLKDAHAALARQSTNSRHTVVDGAGHEIHLFKPSAVIQAIKDVLEARAR